MSQSRLYYHAPIAEVRRIIRTQGAALDRVDTKALAPAVYCTGRRPDAAGGWARACVTSAQRKVGWLF